MTKVLVHGNPETKAVWRLLIAALAERGIDDVVTLDIPGFGAPIPDGFAGTAPVASFPANDYGLYDMAGNVWEWCSDFVGSYGNEEQVNPYNLTGFQSRRAARGGRWGGGAQELRATARMGWVSHDRCNNIGFRVVLVKADE